MSKKDTEEPGKSKDRKDQCSIDLTEIFAQMDKAPMEVLQQLRDYVLKKTEPVVLTRTAKADVFTDMFGRSPYQQELYESLTGEKRDKSEFRTITAENYIVGEIHNDLGFLVGDEIVVLCEAQSTWNVNIVFRVLCYLVQAWRRLAQEKGWSVFATPAIPLPEPKLYVVYTGSAEQRPSLLKLSEVYFGGRDVPIELEVKVVRGHNGDILEQYVRFTEILNEAVKEHGRTRAAAQQIIQRCREESILVSYIAERGSTEMIDMLTSVFDEEEAQRVYVKDLLRKETAGLTKQVADQKEQLAEKDQQLIERDRELTDKDKQLAERDQQLIKRNRELTDKDKQLAERDRELADKDKLLADERKQAEAVRRDAHTDRLNTIISTGLALGADHPSIVQQLAEQGKLSQAQAEQFLRVRLASTE